MMNTVHYLFLHNSARFLLIVPVASLKLRDSNTEPFELQAPNLCKQYDECQKHNHHSFEFRFDHLSFILPREYWSSSNALFPDCK